jgi:AraC-like DNA-binding protein
VGDQQLAVQAGDAVLLQPGQDHELLSETPDFELFVLAVTPALADRCGLHASRRLGAVALHPRSVSTLRDAWLGVGKLTDAPSVEANLCETFKSVAERFDEPSALCRRALQSVHADLDSSEGLIASRLRAHPSCVSRSVREHTGVRLVEYRSRVRLMAFVKEVDAGATMTQAAFRSGFGSYAQLHRAFRKHFMCTPVRYFGGVRQEVSALLRRDVP